MQIFCSGNPATSSTGVTSLDLEIMAVRTLLPPELTKWNLQIGPCWSHAPLSVVHAHWDPVDQSLLCVTHQTRMDKHHRIHRGRQFWSDPKPRSSHIRKSPTTNLLAHFYKRFDFDRHCIYILIPLWILLFVSFQMLLRHSLCGISSRWHDKGRKGYRRRLGVPNTNGRVRQTQGQVARYAYPNNKLMI